MLALHRSCLLWFLKPTLGQAAETYNVVGNMNEYQLTIGETTFGGLPSLGNQPGAIMDYGSLIWVTLQRARTAREAISLFHNLTSAYGYASEGESFSIADPNEVSQMHQWTSFRPNLEV